MTMAGELIIFPVRFGFRVARFAVRTGVHATGQALTLAAHVIRSVTPDGSAEAPDRPAPNGVAPNVPTDVEVEPAAEVEIEPAEEVEIEPAAEVEVEPAEEVEIEPEEEAEVEIEPAEEVEIEPEEEAEVEIEPAEEVEIEPEEEAHEAEPAAEVEPAVQPERAEADTDSVETPTPTHATASEATPLRVEPEHVSVEPTVVDEFAEPGAEEGAGAEVNVAEPWEGYAQLSAEEVISRLADAAPAELAAVQLYESANKQRATVIAAAARELRAKSGPGAAAADQSRKEQPDG
jgi:hypothetical protein